MNSQKIDPEFLLQLEQTIRGHSNKELISVLKKREQYLPEAARQAINEALRRGIIKTELELNSPEFSEPPRRFTFFPGPENKEGQLKLVKSLSRSLLVAGIIPIIFGVLKFMVWKYVEGTSLIIFGLLWITAAWLIMERQMVKYIAPMAVIALLSMIYAARILLLYNRVKVMDITILMVLYAVIFYLLIYIRVLIKRSQIVETDLFL